MKKLFIIAVALILSLSASFAQDQQLPNDPAVRKGLLDNGMTYYIRHNALPEQRAEFYLVTNVGAIQETPEQDGLAHFLEHMCFNGTKNFPGKGILDYLQSIGASFGGNVNAGTGVEQTVYYLTNIPLVNDTVVDSCILILHDYSHFVLCEDEEINAERGVIVAERTERRNASWRVSEQSKKLLFAGSKYADCSLIGSEENLLNFDPQHLRDFYHTWYRPDLQAVIVVGDIDVDEIEKKIKSIFSDIAAVENPKAKEVITIPDNKEPIVGIITDPELSATEISVVWKGEAMPEEMNSTATGYLMKLIKYVASTIMAERIYDIVARPDAPFLNASFGIGKLCETSEVVMGEAVARENEVIPAFTAYMTEIERMKRFGFTSSEISRAKDQIISALETASQRAETRKNSQLVNELVNNFLDNEAYMDPELELQVGKSLLESISVEVMKVVMAEYITDENLVIILTAPQKEGVVLPSEKNLMDVVAAVKASDIQPNEEDVTETELLDASKLKGAKVKSKKEGLYESTEWVLKNGLKVILRPSDLEKDKIIINFYKEGGESLIPTTDLASFEDNIWSLYVKNTGVSKFPATELSKMLAGKNVSVSPFISSIHHGIVATSNQKDIETAFQLLYLTFADPRFDQDEFDQGINMIKAVLPNLKNQPNYKLQQAVSNTFYGGNPRSFVIDDDVVEKASLKTIESNYRRLFNDAAGATAIIAGDFTLEEIQPLVEKYLGSIKKGKQALNWVDTNCDMVEDNIVNDFKVTMETPIVTVVDTYFASMPYSVESAVALAAAEYILDMRYTTSLREEEGGTYGARLSNELSVAPKQKALLQIYFNCKPEFADNLRALVTKGINDFIENGPTDTEFDMALNNLKKMIPEKRITNTYWMSKILTYNRFGIETDAAYEQAVNELTPAKLVDILKAVMASNHKIELVMRPE